MDARKIILVISIILLVSLLKIPIASALDEPLTYERTLSLYAPARIVIMFSYADNVTHSDVSSSNRSVWRLETSPVNIVFSTDMPDVFYFNIQIDYAILTEQIIILDAYSGSRQTLDQSRIPTRPERTIGIHFQLVVVEEPYFPSVEEYAEVILRNFPTKADFQEWIAYARHQDEVFTSNLTTMWVVVGVMAAICFVTVLVAVWRRPRNE